MRRPFKTIRCGRSWLLRTVVAFALLSTTVVAQAGPKRGDGLQTDSLSMLLASRDYTTRTTTTVREVVNLSANVGLHYYFVDDVRLGMSLQFTGRLWPEPAAGSSRFQRFALMPQLGWNFYDPLYTALIFSYAPRTLGRNVPDLAVLAVLGVSLPVSERMKFTVALDVPFAFLHHRTLGLVALMGVSFRI
jgi:hypothetical protein